MWMAWDRYRSTGRGDLIKVEFWSGMPTMFSVKKLGSYIIGPRMEWTMPRMNADKPGI